jgi:hypothetical protein
MEEFNMQKQLLFNVDNTVFNSDQELLEYVKRNYVSELEEKDIKLDELLNKLQTAFPNFKVNIENGKGWYCDYRVFISNDLMRFEERLGNNNNPNKSFDPNPETIEEIIKILNYHKETVEYIINEVNRIADFNIKCTNHSNGYSPNEGSYEFTFKVDGEERYAYYHPCNKTKDEFIKEFYQYVLTKLEGKLETIYDDGYFVEYKIDGIPIEGFVGKKVRIEVIE